MSKLRRNTVQIVNPRPGGAPYTTSKSALQFVRRGLAVFEAGEGAIRFVDQDHRIKNSKKGDGIGGEFWWRLGKTGGMSQQIGSIVFPVTHNPWEGSEGAYE
jgi:hypothetical protein